MVRRMSVVVLVSLGVLGALAPSASAAANPPTKVCWAGWTSSADDVGATLSGAFREQRSVLALELVVYSAQTTDCSDPG